MKNGRWNISFRCTKEKKSYEKEVEKMEEKIAKMKADGEDEYKIMKQVRARDSLPSHPKNLCAILQVTRTSAKCVER